jgi:hypothetical protein
LICLPPYFSTGVLSRLRFSMLRFGPVLPPLEEFPFLLRSSVCVPILLLSFQFLSCSAPFLGFVGCVLPRQQLNSVFKNSAEPRKPDVMDYVGF